MTCSFTPGQVWGPGPSRHSGVGTSWLSVHELPGPLGPHLRTDRARLLQPPGGVLSPIMQVPALRSQPLGCPPRPALHLKPVRPTFPTSSSQYTTFLLHPRASTGSGANKELPTPQSLSRTLPSPCPGPPEEPLEPARALFPRRGSETQALCLELGATGLGRLTGAGPGSKNSQWQLETLRSRPKVMRQVCLGCSVM